jgi:hypothetical protein
MLAWQRFVSIFNMTKQQQLNFANQDLRNRSFKGRNLQGADFSGADLRGCNFSRALLIDANLERVQTGQTRRQLAVLVALALVVGLLVGDAVSRLIFAALGQTAEKAGWNFVLALYASLGIAGIGIGLKTLVKPRSLLAKMAGVVSATASGTLVGFFYGGTMGGQLFAILQQDSPGENNPQTAIVGAVFLGLLMAVSSFKARNGIVPVIVATAGTVTAYGFAFLIGTTAIALLTTSHWFWGSVLGTVSVLYLWITLKALALIVQAIKQSWGTSFRKANLTNARFDGAKLENTEFREAIAAKKPIDP